MANLAESSLWEPGIYRWEDTDPLQGGENGIDNVPTRQLANRTRWLRDRAVLDNEPKTISSLHTFSAGLVTGLIHRGTADGADNGALSLAGGGAADTGRGAHLVLNGNQTAADGGHIRYVAGSKGRHRFITNDGVATSLEKLVIDHATPIHAVGGLTVSQTSPGTGGGFFTRAVTYPTDGTYGALYCPANNKLTLEVGNNSSYGVCQLMPGGGYVTVGAVPSLVNASAGDLVLGWKRPVRNVIDTGNDTIPLIHADKGSVYGVRVASLHPLLVGQALDAGSAAGDVMLAYGKAVRGNNAGSNGSWSMIRTTADSSTQKVDVGDPNAPVSIGGANVGGAIGGELVLGNQRHLRATNAAGTTSLPLLQMNASNETRIGWSAGAGMYLNTFHAGVDPGQTSWSSYVNWGNSAGIRRIMCSNAPPAGAWYLYFIP
jgi:hypothetical protein